MTRRDPKHLEFVRSQACCVPGCTRTPVQAHHIRTAANSGTGIKPDDQNAVGLCGEHHHDLHQHGARTFQTRHAIDLAATARDMVLMAKAPEGLF